MKKKPKKKKRTWRERLLEEVTFNKIWPHINHDLDGIPAHDAEYIMSGVIHRVRKAIRKVRS